MPSLTLLPELRQVLNAALRLADFIRIDFSFTFSQRVKEIDLLDFELMDHFRQKLEAVPSGGALSLSGPELRFVYVLIDLLCKSYFGQLGSFQQTEYLKRTRAGEEEWLRFRSQNLSVASRMLGHLNGILEKDESFAKTRSELDSLAELMDIF